MTSMFEEYFIPVKYEILILCVTKQSKQKKYKDAMAKVILPPPKKLEVTKEGGKGKQQSKTTNPTPSKHNISTPIKCATSTKNVLSGKEVATPPTKN